MRKRLAAEQARLVGENAGAAAIDDRGGGVYSRAKKRRERSLLFSF